MSSWRRRLVAAMGDELGRARGEARLLAERTAERAESERGRAERVIGDATRKQTQLRHIHEKMTATLQARKAAAVEGGHRAPRRRSRGRPGGRRGAGRVAAGVGADPRGGAAAARRPHRRQRIELL
nr:hypothetical protein GCM10025732_59350 [Glycomyces mayteni]